MDKNWKIDKINAYRKLLSSKKLPKIEGEKDRTVETELLEEFEAWGNAQIASLLGESTPAGFSEDETLVLKHFAQKMLAQASNPTAPAPAQPRAPRAARPAVEPPQNGITEADRRIIERSKPLRNHEDKAGRVLNAEEKKLLDRLDKMDNEGPEY